MQPEVKPCDAPPNESPAPAAEKPGTLPPVLPRGLHLIISDGKGATAQEAQLTGMTVRVEVCPKCGCHFPAITGRVLAMNEDGNFGREFKMMSEALARKERPAMTTMQAYSPQAKSPSLEAKPIVIDNPAKVGSQAGALYQPSPSPAPTKACP